MKTNRVTDLFTIDFQSIDENSLANRVFRIVMIAIMAIACAGLARMADGQTPPRIEDGVTPQSTARTTPTMKSDRIAQPVSYSIASNYPIAEAGSDCGCRNIPGGYPCKGSCQPCMSGVDCASNCGAESTWKDMRPMDFDSYSHGGYAGPARLAHLSHYRLRPRDVIEIIYLVTRKQSSGSYRLEVGDEVMIESVSDVDLTRGTLQNGLRIQPDGTITVRILGQVQAAGLTVDALRSQLEKLYSEYYEDPTIDVTPIKTNTLADDIRNAVGGAGGFVRQSIDVTVTPDGKVQLPGIGEICVQGLTMSEMKQEVNLRYGQRVIGLEVEPILRAQAPHVVYVLGEVRQANRVVLDGPTTVLGSIAVAGGPTPGANLRQVVVFRRAEDWRLISTMLDLQGAVYGKRPTPTDEIWLRDGDVIVVPARPIVRFNWFVDQVFTQGAYGLIPPGLSLDLNGDSN